MTQPDLLPHGNVLGIDTHKFVHVATLLDGLGRVLDTLTFAATDQGATELLAWFDDRGAPVSAGIEGTGSYGYQLTRRVQAAGITVQEVNRPDRANRRRKGKSDSVDAEAAARAVLSGQATSIPKDREGAVESLQRPSRSRPGSWTRPILFANDPPRASSSTSNPRVCVCWCT